MKRMVWFGLVALGGAACGGNSFSSSNGDASTGDGSTGVDAPCCADAASPDIAQSTPDALADAAPEGGQVLVEAGVAETGPCTSCPGDAAPEAGHDAGQDSASTPEAGQDSGSDATTDTGSSDGGSESGLPIPDGGVCSPGVTQCSGNSAFETCSSAGQWGSSQSCSGSTPVCLNGACSCPNTVCGSSCVNLAGNNANNCGACGHSCGGGSCVGGVCKPVAIYTATASIIDLVVDSANLYWILDSSGSGVYGQPQECSKTSCTSPITLGGGASATSYVSDLAVDSTTVYWTIAAAGTGELMSCTIGGCGSNPTLLAQASSYWSAIAVDANHVYWGGYSGPYVGSKTTYMATLPTAFSGSVTGVYRVAVDSTTVYWIAGGSTIGPLPSQTLYSCPITGCPSGGATALVTGGSNALVDLAVDGTNLYYTTGGGYGGQNAVMTCDKATCSNPAPLYVAGNSSGATFGDLVVDARNVYWTNTSMGTGSTSQLLKCANGGCGNSPTSMVTPTTGIGRRIADDTTFVYYADGNALTRLAK